MDSGDLLARENEFKKLNKQLEKKTESLMKEIEHAMQRKDIFSEFTSNLTLSPVHNKMKRLQCGSPIESFSSTNYEPRKNNKLSNNQNTNSNENNIKKAIPNSNFLAIDKDNQNVPPKTNFHTDIGQTKNTGTHTDNTKIECYCCQPQNQDTDMEFVYAFTSICVKDKILPQSFMKDSVSFERICKFLSAKIKLLQEDIDKLQTVIGNKSKQCEGHMKQLAEMEGEKFGLLNKVNSMKSETTDMRAKYGVIQEKFSEKERLCKEQRSTTDRQTTELKQLKLKNVNLEARCATQEELISTLKHQVESAKVCEKEFKASSRNLSASHQTAISRLEQRVKLLTTTIDKQAVLIDNLRKQIALLTSEGALAALERDYSEFLTQDF